MGEVAAVPSQAPPRQPYLDSEVGPPYSSGRANVYVEERTAGSPEPAASALGSDREAASPEAARSESRSVAAENSAMEEEDLVSAWVEADDKSMLDVVVERMQVQGGTQIEQDPPCRSS